MMILLIVNKPVHDVSIGTVSYEFVCLRYLFHDLFLPRSCKICCRW